jgi:quinol monooxygenase YgiN
MSGFAVLVSFKSAPGKAEALCEALLEGARMMTAAKCRIHLTSRDRTDPDLVWVVEFWDSEADNLAARAAPQAQALTAQVMALTTTGAIHSVVNGDLVGSHGL